MNLGFNKQKGNFVYGVEADYGYLGVKGKSGPSPWSQDDTFLHTNATSYGTARLRLGYAMNRFLPYVTVGGAVATFNSYVDDPDIAIGVMSQQTGPQFGLVGGIGAEYAILDNVSVKADLLSMTFQGQKSIGYVNVTCIPGTCPPQWKLDRLGMAGDGTAGWRISHTLNVGRVGINMKF